MSLESLRIALGRRCRRVCVVHQPAGRYFVEPSCGWLVSLLGTACWQPFDFGAVRLERLRRLAPFLNAPAGAHQPAGRSAFYRLALRLEALSREHHPGLVRHSLEEFDGVWQRVPLFAVTLDSLQKEVLRSLLRVSDFTGETPKFGE